MVTCVYFALQYCMFGAIYISQNVLSIRVEQKYLPCTEKNNVDHVNTLASETRDYKPDI